MEGRGTTNYAPDKPSYAFTTRTTEFDDALISRGIVTFEQAMIAKGASPQEARRLYEIECGSNVASAGMESRRGDKGGKDTDDQSDDDGDTIEKDGSDDENDEDKFLERYRQQRLEELKKKKGDAYGEVIHISRPDWNREVNDASLNGRWVFVNLLRSGSSHSMPHDAACDAVEVAVRNLANRFDGIKFVSIASTSAIENWPAENLPTLFCYRDGMMRHQLIGAESFGGPGVNGGRIEWRLAALGVLETDLVEDPRPDDYDRIARADIEKDRRYGGDSSSRFGGVMSQLATTRIDGDSDYDEVD